MMLRSRTILVVSCVVAVTALAFAGQAATTRPANTATPSRSSYLSRPSAAPGKPVMPPRLGAAPAKPATRPANTAGAPTAVRPPVVLDASALPGGPKPGAPSGTQKPDDKEILIVQALEQPTNLHIEDAPLGEAIRVLSENTGVPIEFDRFVLGCLPYGSKTLVSAKIENRPLKESLTALLQPLASKYVVENETLMICPRPALFRIGRRATWDEVATIEKLYRSAWTKELADSLQFQFQDMSSADAEANRKKIYALAGSVGAGNAAHVLEYACSQYGWAWHPEGKAIAICTSTRQIQQQLDRPVSAQYSEVQLKDVLLDLASRAGVNLKMEPGVLTSLPTQQAERFRMTLENVSIRQALELIAGETGLNYFVEPDGIRISAASFTPAAASTGSTGSPRESDSIRTVSTNPIIGQVTVPGENGTSYSFFIREQDLPPDVNQLRLQHLRWAADRMRDVLSTRPVE